MVERKYDIKDDAKFAYDKACEAIEDGKWFQFLLA